MRTRSVLGLVCLTFFFAGCDANPSVDVVDLNKVLDALVAVLDESDAGAPAGEAPVEGELAPQQENAGKDQEFLTKYAAKLNEMKAMESSVGVAFTGGGEIIGFQDPNGNNTQDAGETKEFTVVIDPENSRLVASDNNGHHRPYGYRPGGFFTGYLIGSMLSRQGSFYSGANSGAKPTFRNTPMSSSDYHKGAVSSARSAAASSARARTGSKGFSFGK